MKTNELNNSNHFNSIAREDSVSQYKQSSSQLVVGVVLISFILALLPIVYGFSLTSSPTQKTVTVPGEATLWSDLGER